MKDSDEEQEEFEYVKLKEKEKFDCKSIISTYSNIYNRPKIIDEPQKPKMVRISAKGIPLFDDTNQKLTVKALSQFDSANDAAHLKPDDVKSMVSELSILSIRPKDETPEEKRERKKNLKEYRRDRRMEKKETKRAFGEDHKHEVKVNLNRANVKGKRLV